MKRTAPGRSGTPYLEVRGVTKRFGTCRAVDDLSFAVDEGGFVCLLGPSGCGKTTLLRIVAGLARQDAGTVHLHGKDVTHLPTGQRRCGIVFQSYALFPNLCAWRNVAYGLRGKGLTRARARALAMEKLELVGLSEAAAKYPSQLSGGQQQRVALARALAPEPELLLLDEPFSALDARVRVRLRHEVRRIQQQLGITTVMVTHDQEEALTLADHIVVMDEGRVAQAGAPGDIYHGPSTAFVAGFIGAMNFLEGWRGGGDGVAARENLSLRAGNGTVANGPVVLAIRPEDVLLPAGDGAPENVLAGTVRDVEFRGPVYRVRVGLAAAPHELDVDVQADRLEQHPMPPGESVTLRLPPERLLSFPESAGP